MTVGQTFVRTQGVIEAEVDGDRVLMHPEDFAYYGLTDTGAVVWALLDGSRTVDEIVAELALNYDAEPSVIQRDVELFLTGLQSARLIDDHTG